MEERMDPVDGEVYTKEDFIDCYGGTKEWDLAPQVGRGRHSACEGQETGR